MGQPARACRRSSAASPTRTSSSSASPASRWSSTRTQFKTGEVIAPFEKARASKPHCKGAAPRRFWMFSLDLLFEALLFGVLLGCFYAAVSIGLSVSFGLLDVPHVAHPAIMVLGSYCTYLLAGYGCDPLVAGVLLMPPFFLLGMLIYRFYYETFEKRGSEAGVRGLAFFFGLAFIIEVGLILRLRRRPALGAGGLHRQEPRARRVPRAVCACWSRSAWRSSLTFALTLYLSKTFTGRAIKAVAQDEPALRLMGANPVRIKQWAFGIATGVSALAGAMLIIVGPVEPAIDRALHRPHLLRGGARRPGQHDRHAGRRR